MNDRKFASSLNCLTCSIAIVFWIVVIALFSNDLKIVITIALIFVGITLLMFWRAEHGNKKET